MGLLVLEFFDAHHVSLDLMINNLDGCVANLILKVKSHNTYRN